VQATAVAVAASSGNGFGLSVGGLWTDNKIATILRASIDGDAHATLITSGAVQVTADNTATITADAQAVWSSTNAVGLSTSVARALTLAGVLAGATLKLQYKSTSGAGNFSNRWLHVIPARVQ